jgi:hypothetical protein
MKKVDVLGTEYKVIRSTASKDYNLRNIDGYCDNTSKRIVIDAMIPMPGTVDDLDKYAMQVVRHELVHAFLFESGLSGNSWANNDEIVDWIAIMFPKMLEAFYDAGAI